MRVTQKHLVYSLLFTMAVVSVFILFIGYVSWSPINAQAVARIEPLMTEEQVEQILGGKCNLSFPTPERRIGDKIIPQRTIKMWHDDRARCIVYFDAAGRVERASLVDANPGILNTVRAALRLRW